MRPLSARALHVDDAEYPAALRRLSDPPPILHMRGTLEGLERAVGIVGTRRATPGALALTRELARTLAERGVVIVSGGAEGVDRAAHEGALDAEHGRTIAVLPTALGSPYPRAHAALFERITRRGACVTEHASSARVYKASFLERNRIIAALSCAVVVVQAPSRSGALRTAFDATALGVPVLAVPWSPSELAAAGGLALLARGAGLCRDAEDVLAAIGESPRSERRQRRRAAQLGLLDDDQQLLLALLDDTALDRDLLLTRTNLPTSRAQAALARLVIDGLAHEDAHGVRRAPR